MLWDGTIRGDFMSEPGGEITQTMDLSTGDENYVAASFPEDEDRCELCYELASDAENTECRGNEGGEHDIKPQPLAWLDKVKIKPDAEYNEAQVLIQPTGEMGRIRITLRPDPETGQVRMIVESTTTLLPVHRVESDTPDRTDFLIG